MKAWTDYPIRRLGDKDHEPAPVRECTVMMYDGDKHCQVILKENLFLRSSRQVICTKNKVDGAKCLVSHMKN